MRHFFDFFFVAIGGSNAATIAYEMKVRDCSFFTRLIGSQDSRKQNEADERNGASVKRVPVAIAQCPFIGPASGLLSAHHSRALLPPNSRLTSSKTFFNPLCVKAEHSTYFTAPNSLANLSPISGVIGFILCLPNFSIWAGSSLKSTWVPTISAGTPGQWWAISGNHFSRTFSKEAGDVTEKQTRKTSVWGYESGRRRS